MISICVNAENDFVHSNGLKDEKRGSLIKKSSSSQLNVTNIVNINEKDEHLNSIIRYQTLQPLHFQSNKNGGGKLNHILIIFFCYFSSSFRFFLDDVYLRNSLFIDQNKFNEEDLRPEDKLLVLKNKDNNLYFYSKILISFLLLILRNNENNMVNDFYKNLRDQFNLNLIPPPRSFSDNNEMSTSITKNNNFNNVNSSLHNSNESSYLSDKINFDDSSDSNYSSNTKGTIPVCIIKSTNTDGKLTLSNEMILEEEVPTKVPQINAIPKKSAMKKPRVDNLITAATTSSIFINGTTSSITFANKFTPSKLNNNSSGNRPEASFKVSFPELKSVIKGLKSNPNSINIQCKYVIDEDLKNKVNLLTNLILLL